MGTAFQPSVAFSVPQIRAFSLLLRVSLPSRMSTVSQRGAAVANIGKPKNRIQGAIFPIINFITASPVVPVLWANTFSLSCGNLSRLAKQCPLILCLSGILLLKKQFILSSSASSKKLQQSFKNGEKRSSEPGRMLGMIERLGGLFSFLSR